MERVNLSMLVRHFMIMIVLAVAGGGGCARCDPPSPPSPHDAFVSPPPPPPAPAVRDAGPDVVDAGLDASDGGAPPARHGTKRSAGATAGGNDGIKVEGSLSKSDAEKIVRGGFARLRRCNPDLKGRVTVRLSIDDRGRVSLGEIVKSTIGGGDPEMCMVRAASDLKFPSSAGESTVTFQMTFTP